MEGNQLRHGIYRHTDRRWAHHRDGMEQPRYFWRPSIAPSGLVFYTGDMFPEWRGNIFVTSLSGQHLSRLVVDRLPFDDCALQDRFRHFRRDLYAVRLKLADDALIPVSRVAGDGQYCCCQAKQLDLQFCHDDFALIECSTRFTCASMNRSVSRFECG